MRPYAEEMSAFVSSLQTEICDALEQLDGTARFNIDPWQRVGGGGGNTRVLSEGSILERAGVNTSHVHGDLDDVFAQRMPGDGRTFSAVGISMVLHPRSPMVPTMHANVRFITHGTKSWFGGGIDLTPYYLFPEDAAHFHAVLKAACDRHDGAHYPRFKKWCDEYFYLEHRSEARGIGGVFFDDLGGDLEKAFAFAKDIGRAILPAYLPIAQRRKGIEFTDAQRVWQEIRRGRYVEFNLLYDRGTKFGLETRGRTESILMSLPPRVRWVYDHRPVVGSDEARLMDVIREPRDWA